MYGVQCHALHDLSQFAGKLKCAGPPPPPSPSSAWLLPHVPGRIVSSRACADASWSSKCCKLRTETELLVMETWPMESRGGCRTCTMQLDKARNRRKEQGVARSAAPRTGKKRRLAATRASGLASELGSPQALSASPGSRSGRQQPAVG